MGSVTRLGDFLKFLATNFLTKVAQISSEILGHLATLRKIVLLFIISTSGFSDHGSIQLKIYKP